jgi:hypothetical protein
VQAPFTQTLVWSQQSAVTLQRLSLQTQIPLSQFPEQQSPLLVQAASIDRQLQTPLVHGVSQQSLWLVQVAPEAP